MEGAESAVRFTLGRMLTFVAAVAAVCASLAFANQWLGDVYYTLCIAAIFLALVAAIGAQGERRAYWLGFFAAGMTYGMLTIFWGYGETSNFYNAIQHNGEIAGYSADLVTSRLLTYGYDYVAVEGGSGQHFQGKTEFERFMPYLTIGHSVFALLCGWGTGVLARRLYRRRVIG